MKPQPHDKHDQYDKQGQPDQSKSKANEAKAPEKKSKPSALGRFARGFASILTGQTDPKSKEAKKAEKLARMTANAEKAQIAAARIANKQQASKPQSTEKKEPVITAQQYSRQKEVNQPNPAKPNVKPAVEGITIPAIQNVQAIQTPAPKPELDPRVIEAIESIKSFTQSRVEKEQELLSAIEDTKARVNQSADNVSQTVSNVSEHVSQELDKQLNQSVDQISSRVEATVDSLSEEVKTFRKETIESMQLQLTNARRSSRHGWQAAMAASLIGVVSLTFSLMYSGGGGLEPEEVHQQLANQRSQYQEQIEQHVQLIENQTQRLSLLEQELNDNNKALEAANNAIDQMLAAAEGTPDHTLSTDTDTALGFPPDEGLTETSDSALSIVE